MNIDTKQDESGTFLPDFCAIRSVFLVVLIAELLALVITLAGGGPLRGRLDDLAFNSLFVQWVALACTALLCASRPWLARFQDGTVAVIAYVAMLLVTWALSELAWWVTQAEISVLVTATHGELLLRTLGISVIVSAVVLRYFYVQNLWQRRVRSESLARFQALQARIRPHFFFNCMNTIASLTRSSPAAAEKAVEDLADLFRASLSDARDRVPLVEELNLCQQYLDIEKLRLGARLQVDWDTSAVPQNALLPALTLQPFLENAIYHGIEPQPAGGTILLRGRCVDGGIELTIENPVAPNLSQRHDGNRLAQENVRQRLAAIYGVAAALRVEENAERYRVTLTIPYRKDDEDPDR